MRRRNLLRGAVLAPAAAAVAALPAAAAPQYASPSATPAPTADAARLTVNEPSYTGAQRTSFFDILESNALRALAAALVPAHNGMPGAIECGVPEFLDFHTAQAPPDRQQLWRSGLNSLDARSLARFGARFHTLTPAQTAEILAPLQQKWTFYGPSEDFDRFLWQARADMLTATLNAREYAEANTGRRAAAASNYYWRSLD